MRLKIKMVIPPYHPSPVYYILFLLHNIKEDTHIRIFKCLNDIVHKVKVNGVIGKCFGHHGQKEFKIPSFFVVPQKK